MKLKPHHILLALGLLLGALAASSSGAERLSKEELKHQNLLDKRDTLLGEIKTLENAITAPVDANDAAAVAKRKADEASLAAKKLELAVTETALVAQETNAVVTNAGATDEQKKAAAAAAVAADVIKAAAMKAAQDAEDGVDAKFRQAGVSFSTGGGVVGKGSAGGTIGTVIARWNVIQARTTARHNARRDLAKVGYSRVLTGGGIGQVFKFTKAQELAGLPEDKVPFLTAVGPFIGRAIQGDSIQIGAKRERPWLLGASLGFGTYDQASSLFYLEAGYALSPSQGFSHAKGFVGLSFDAVVFSKITGLTKPAKPASN